MSQLNNTLSPPCKCKCLSVCVFVYVSLYACAPAFSCLHVSSLAFGNCNGLAVVDYLQKTILMCMSTLDLYGTADPYQRLTRSPRRNRQSTSGNTRTHRPLGSGRTHPHNKLSIMQSLQSNYLAVPFSALLFSFSTFSYSVSFLISEIRLIYQANLIYLSRLI